MQFVTIALLAILFVATGCGAGSDATEQVAAEETTPATTEISTQADASNDAPPEAPASDGELKAEIVSSPRGSQAMGIDAKAGTMTSSPAVDTSQLMIAPDWAMPDLAGQIISNGDYEGKVVLVDFWATWCGPCKKSIPHLIELQNEYKDQGVVVLGVSVDQGDPQKTVKPFVEKAKINYPIVMGNQKIVQSFGGVRGIPTAFIISQDGKIFRKLVGLRPKEHYEEPIKMLLGVS